LCGNSGREQFSVGGSRDCRSNCKKIAPVPICRLSKRGEEPIVLGMGTDEKPDDRVGGGSEAQCSVRGCDSYRPQRQSRVYVLKLQARMIRIQNELLREEKGTQLFSRSAEVPNVSDSRAVRLQIAVPLPYT
jgi:hypothetical protein